MLNRLTISNYALIDSLDIAFPKGLIIITGETGAGKSILLGALSLLLGGKSDVSVINDKSRNCVVEAEFSADDKDYILRRVVSPAGRSRVFINDEPASLDEIRDLSSKLVDIHAQHQHLLLSNPDFQLSVLDSYAGIRDEVDAYNKKYDEYLSVKAQLACLDEKIGEIARNRDYLEYQYKRLEDAKLISGELETLEQEQVQLAHSEQIKSDLEQICSIFSSEELSIVSALKEVESLISRNSSYYPEFDSIASRVESARIELKDIEEEVQAKQESVVCSPERLNYVEDRLALLYDLMRKEDVRTVEELIEKRDSLSAALEQGVDFQLERDSLAKKLETVASECKSLAETLHKKRLNMVSELSATLQNSIRTLEMPNSLFEVRVNEKPNWARNGIDGVSFVFSANGGAMTEISKVASGGELSRVMLCIKALLAEYVGMPTMIFDEIDTGVSGRIADKMGSMIGRMGENMQVFAITHLPQVASKGSAHFLVYKITDDSNVTKTNIREISGAARVEEIARMLSGSTLTPEAVANAKVLLDQKLF